MAETFDEMVDRILRDHEGYTGDGNGGVGDLPDGDRSTARKPIDKRDLRVLMKAPESYASRAEAAASAAEGIVGGVAYLDGAVAQAEAARDAAVVSESVASGHATSAEAAKAAAEAARDAATVNAQVYADTAAGLAATTVGDQFQVVAGDEVIRYRHDAGPVATEVARYPSAAAVLSSIEPQTGRLVRALPNRPNIDPAWLPPMEALIPEGEAPPFGWWATGEKVAGSHGGKIVISNWTPAELAAAGFEGNWISATDPAYLFQDREGLVPVTDYGQPVRLAVCRLTGDPRADRTYAGLVNGDFASDLSGWTIPAGQASVWDNGRAHVYSGGGATGISQALTGLVPGRVYRVTATAEVDAASTGSGRRAELTVTGASKLSGNVVTAAGVVSEMYLAFEATATTATLWLRASSTTPAGPAVWYDDVSIFAPSAGDYFADGVPPIYAQHEDGGPCLRWRYADNSSGLRPAIGLSMLDKPQNFVAAVLGSRESDANWIYYIAAQNAVLGIRNGASASGGLSDGLFGYSTPPGSSLVGAGAGTERSGMEGVALTSYWGGTEPQRLYRNRTLLAQAGTPAASSVPLTTLWTPHIGNRAEGDRPSDVSVRDWLFGRADRALTPSELRRLNTFVSRDAAPPLGPEVTRVASIGASSTAGWTGNPVTITLVGTRHTPVSLDLGGSTIASRKAAWLGYAHKTSIRWVNIQIGMNDMAPGLALPTLLGRLQDLVDTVRLYLPPGAIIMLSQVTPARGRWHDLFGETDGDLVYHDLWLPYNEAIMGRGPTPIIGVDIRVDAHQIALNDGNGYLKPERDRGDHIHFDAVGCQINADAWSAALTSYGAANGLPNGWW